MYENFTKIKISNKFYDLNPIFSLLIETEVL